MSVALSKQTFLSCLNCFHYFTTKPWCPVKKVSWCTFWSMISISLNAAKEIQNYSRGLWNFGLHCLVYQKRKLIALFWYLIQALTCRHWDKKAMSRKNHFSAYWKINLKRKWKSQLKTFLIFAYKERRSAPITLSRQSITFYNKNTLWEK